MRSHKNVGTKCVINNAIPLRGSRRVDKSVPEEVYPKGCPDYDYIYVFPNLFKPVKGSRVEGQVIENVYSWQECGEYFNNIHPFTFPFS